MKKMTAQQVAALKPRERPYETTVDNGLELRVAMNGVKTWIVRYVVDRKQRDYRLPRQYGLVTDEGHLSLADARNEAMRIRALARNGIDIQVQEEEARAAEVARKAQLLAAETERKALLERENLTVCNMFEVWLRDGVRRQDDNAGLRRSFDADVLPSIGKRPIRELTEHDVRAVLRAIVARGANRTAVIVRNNLAQLFAWAEKRQPWRKLLVDGNPIDLIEIEKIVSPDFDLDYQRERILPDDEIRELRDIFRQMRVNYDNAPNKRVCVQPVEETTQLAMWIMLSTLCRVGETSMARWEHVDLDAGKWFIPKTNVKRKVANLDVFLSPFALEHFRQLHKITGHTEWCFPAQDLEGHIGVKSFSKQIGDRQTQFKKGRDGGPRRPMKNRRQDNSLVLGGGARGEWTPHDLRRTGATVMQSLGVSLDVIDRCQNHVLKGSKVRRHYLHHDYAKEKRAAWQLLGDHLSSILSADSSPGKPR